MYKIDFAGSSLHVLAGKLVIDSITLKPDTAVFNRLKKAGKAPNNLYTLSVNRVVFKHIHPFKLYFKKMFEVDEITISQPSVQVVYQEIHYHDLPDSGKKTFYQQIAGTLKSVHIGQILLNNINLRYQEEINHRIKITRIKEINLKGTDFLIDSASRYDKSRCNFGKDITVRLNNYSGKTANNLYQYQAKSVVFSSSKSSVKIADAVFMPLKTASVSSQKPDLQHGNFTLETDSININHFDYKAFIGYRKLIAADVTVFGRKAAIFYDRTLPKKPVDAAKGNLYALLKNVHQNIAVKTLYLKDIDLVYDEISAKTIS